MRSRAHPGLRRPAQRASRGAARRNAVRDPQEFTNTLVGEIYSALISGDWQPFLDRISGSLPNGKTTLFYHDPAANVGAWTLNSRFDAESVAAYNQYFCSKNPWMAKIPARPIGLGVRAERMLPREQLLRTEFYADFLRPQDANSGVGVTILREHGRSFMLSSLHAPVEDEVADTMASVFGALSPHLRLAFGYYRQAAAVAGASAMVSAVSDALRVGIVAVGFDRRISWANALGRELLSRGYPIGLDVRGRFSTPHTEIRDAVDSALSGAIRGDLVEKTTMTAPSRLSKRLPIRVTLVVPDTDPFERYFVGPMVLVLVEDETRGRAAGEEALREAFGLTPSEARLAAAIAGGATIADAAELQGITRETARTHLKRLFAKMDVHRQAELVRRIHELGRLRD